jgi:carboxyl-terminal processing protease
MQLWKFPVCFGRTWLLLAVVAAVVPSVPGPLGAQSEVRIPSEALGAGGDLAQVLRQGAVLEQEERWVDALTHYEKAARGFPRDRTLQDRLTLAQIHCDIARRYTDVSFQQLASTLSWREAMDMYAEVLLKIQAYYVEEPNWQSMLWRGTASLDVALTKKEFLDVCLPDVPGARINAFRHELRRSVNTQQVSGHEDARAVVGQCSRTAANMLGLKPTAVVLEYVCGAVNDLDQYSSYLTGSQLDDIYDQIEGSFVGLGIEIRADQEGLLVTKTIPGGPAQRSGLQAGDCIIEIDGEPTREVPTDKAADRLKGMPGSTVELAVTKTGHQTERYRIRREHVEVPSVEKARIIDRAHGIGYFQLTNFQKSTNREVDAALASLRRQGMKSLIIDVRGNPGGLLTASVEVADQFVPEGLIVQTRGRSPHEDYDYRAHLVGTTNVPLVVLVDKETASASEIFAGAIRDHRRGVVIGQPTYGKGSVQGIFPLDVVKSGLRLTTAKFYSPSGRQISDQGVEPNVLVHEVARVTASGESLAQAPDYDPALAIALETMRRNAEVQR